MPETHAVDDALSKHRRPQNYYRRLESRQIEAAIQRPKIAWIGRATFYLHALASEQVNRQRVSRQQKPDRPLQTTTESLDFIYPQLQELGIIVRSTEPDSELVPILELDEAA